MPPSSTAAYQSLTNFGNTMLKPQDAIAQGNTQYGVNGIQSQLDALRTLTGNLQTSIVGVDPSVTGRTQGGLVTEAQRAAIVNKERAPLVDQFNQTAGHLSDVGHQFDEAQGLASQWAQSVLGNQEQQYQHLFGQYSTSLAAEQENAKAAEAKREFDASLAEQRAARSASANPGLDLSPLLGGSTPSSGTPGQPDINSLLQLKSQDAVASLFNGYNPGVDKYYTEHVVIPKLTQYFASRNPKLGDQAKTLAAQLAYNYRKQKFGE